MKLSHTIWHCTYHIVWTPKYRYRILKDKVKQEVEKCLQIFCEQKKCLIEELNLQGDHVHMLVKIPPKVLVSEFVGTMKGRTAIRVFSKFRKLKEKPYWGNHFWVKGYCIDTVGLDAEMIRKYVKYQEEKDINRERELNFTFYEGDRTLMTRIKLICADP